LDFEGEVSNPEVTSVPLTNKSKTISILSSSYIIDPKYSIFGNKSAYFSGKRNQIHLNVSGSRFFNSSPESFTITIPLLISEQGASSIVMDKTVFIKGKKFGFSLEIEENKLVFYANNLIQKEDGSQISTVLRAPNQIPRKDWHIISIHFDTIQNKILLFQNGYQTAAYQAQGEDIIGIGFPESDSTNLILAKSYFGNIDGFHIHQGKPFESKEFSKYNRVKYSDETKRVSHEGSYVLSPIYSTKFSYSEISKIKFDIDKPTDTDVALYFRGSNQKFGESEEKGPKWNRIELSLKDLSALPKFKFYQWKVWLRSDPQGKQAPTLYGLNFLVKELNPPDAPTNFRVSPMPNDTKGVCFNWNSNHEREVQDHGGYMIFYGVEPDRMIGTLFVKSENGKLTSINGKSEGSDYKNLKYCANEDILITNIYITDEDEKTLPKSLSNPSFSSRKEKQGALFQFGITYYFKIAAYNKYFDEWEGRDQKSKLSAPISFSFPNEVTQR